MSKTFYEVSQGCTLCGMCIYECFTGAITMHKSGAQIDKNKCTSCGKCSKNCASEAIVKRSVNT